MVIYDDTLRDEGGSREFNEFNFLYSISFGIGRTNWNLKISKYLVMITIQAMIFGYFRQESPFFLVVKGSLLEINLNINIFRKFCC